MLGRCRQSNRREAINLRDMQAEREAIRALDLSSTSWEDADQRMAAFGAEYITFPSNHFMPSCYRARPNDRPLFERVEDLWAPPANVAGVNRFNRAGAPVLYLASNPPTAMFEVHAQIGQPVTILACGMPSDVRPLKTAVIGLEHFVGGSIVGSLAPHVSGGLRNVPQFREALIEKGILEQWCLQDDFFAELAMSEAASEDFYKLTIPIWQHLVQQNDSDGLVYPSVQTGRRSFNVALKLRSATFVEPIEAWLVEAREMNRAPNDGEAGFSGVVIRRGAVEKNNTIAWAAPKELSVDEAYVELKQRIIEPPATPALQPMTRGSLYSRTVTMRGYTWNGQQL